MPTLYRPEKASQTVTEGGQVELKCTVLHGHQNSVKLEWSWKKNETDLVENEKFSITGTSENSTVLTIKKVDNDDKGDYVCTLETEFGKAQQTIQVRVKDALAALWPFLAIIAEVVILCVIILVYEKKCAKKPSSQNDEDNEQAQNLMGGAQQNSDVKKRSPK